MVTSTTRAAVPSLNGPRPERAFCDFLLAEVRVVLARHAFTPADRDDVAQQVMVVILRRWPTYRAERGSLRQWIAGIVRLEVLRFRRNRGLILDADEGRPREHVAEDALPETNIAMRELLDELLAELPIQQRQMVILVEVGRLTLREAAALEGTSTTRAHARHKAGIQMLREAAERLRRKQQEERGVAVFPFSLAALIVGARAPEAPLDQRERVWRHVRDQLAREDAGLDEGVLESGRCPQEAKTTVDVEPSSNGLRRGDAGLRLLQCLGLLALALGGPTDGLHSKLWVPASAEPAVLTSALAGSATATPLAATSAAASVPTPSAVPIASSTTPAVRAVSVNDARWLMETQLLDQARAAVVDTRPGVALDALAEHRRRFPRGAGIAARERLWTAACQAARNEPRCAEGAGFLGALRGGNEAQQRDDVQPIAHVVDVRSKP